MMNLADCLYKFKNMNLPAVISAARRTFLLRSIGFRYICSKTLQRDKYSSSKCCWVHCVIRNC